MHTVRALAFHAGWRCQHSGACCTSGWPIPVESDRLAVIERAVGEGRLVGHDGTTIVTRIDPGSPADGARLLTVTTTGCIFHRTHAPRGCSVQHALGHGALPLACRQFPRVSVVDPRGASVTLSHYCPTAARLLDAPLPLAIVTDPAVAPDGSEVDGLDVRESLPPLLRADMLMDWEAWWEFEQRSVAVIAEAPVADVALARLDAAVEHVRAWSPRDGVTLVEHVSRVFDAAPVAPAPHSLDWHTAIDDVLGAIPLSLRPDPAALAGPEPGGEARRRFLAAHAFANWTAHLGRGLRAWLASLRAADVLASRFGVRQADLWLRHLADPQALADAWSRWEEPPASRRQRSRFFSSS